MLLMILIILALMCLSKNGTAVSGQAVLTVILGAAIFAGLIMVSGG